MRGTTGSTREGSLSRSGLKPPCLATLHHLSSQGQVHLGCSLRPRVAKDGRASRAGLQYLAVGADLGAEHQVTPAVPQVVCHGSLLAEPAIELAEQDAQHGEPR